MQTSGQEQDPIIGINVTPLVDVILVLLTIFMVTAPMLHQRALHVQIPKSAHGERTATEALRVEMDGKRKLWLQGKPLVLPDLIRELKIKAERDPETHISLAADQSISYGDVVGLLSDLRAAGIKRVGLEVRR